MSGRVLDVDVDVDVGDGNTGRVTKVRLKGGEGSEEQATIHG